MTTSTVSNPVTPADPMKPVKTRGVFRRLLGDPTAILALSILAIVIAVAAFAPLIAGYAPGDASLASTLAPPFTPEHPLGGDGTGKDVLTQLVYGARTALMSAAIVVGVCMAIGVPTGIIAGYYGGRLDAFGSWVNNALMALPAIVVLLVVLARIERSTVLALVVFGVLISPSAFFLIRSSVRAVREELYVDAAKVSGLRNGRIMRRHVLPVVIAPSIIQAAQLSSAGIGIEAGIAFLGLGSADRASWGNMLADASRNIYTAPLLLLWPSLALVLTVLALTLLGNALRDALGRSPNQPTRRAKKVTRPAAPAAVDAPAVDDDALVAMENLIVSYPQGDDDIEVVRGVSLTVRRGEIVGLVGESGSGKSQTAFSILGLLPPEARVHSDKLHVAGTDARHLTERQRNALRGTRIGYIPQEPMSNLDPAFKIGFQLTEPMRVRLGMSRRAAKEEALRLLARVGIPEPERVFDSYPHEVSGGMAQRVLIAGAVSCHPDLLIADEPTTALDVTVQAEVLDLIRDLQQEFGMGVLLVTHNFGVVADLCDRVAVMKQGRIVEEAHYAHLYRAPEDDYTRMLLGSTLDDAPSRRERAAQQTADKETAR